MYEKITRKQVNEIIGDNIDSHGLRSKAIWKELMKKFNVFYLHKPYFKAKIDAKAIK
jgi:hypothetical protein